MFAILVSGLCYVNVVDDVTVDGCTRHRWLHVFERIRTESDEVELMQRNDRFVNVIGHPTNSRWGSKK